MLIVLIICGFLMAGYVLLMILYMIGWYRQSSFVLKQDFVPQTFISIIIPARNEALNILNCLQSILAQGYPEKLFEIVVVDDFSTDSTAQIVSSLNHPNVRCIKMADQPQGEQTIAYKKKALATAIAKSKGELIVTTDADCTAPNGWLMNIAAIYEQEKPVMIVAPVDFTDDGSTVQIFQSLDFMSMQGITVATRQLNMGSMSNGANLAFTREAFMAVNGYEGTEHVASGDDYLLMNKIQYKYPGKITYLKTKQAIVKTAPQPDWKGFLNQRIRWASKTGKYNDPLLTATLLLVYLFNVSFVVLAILGFVDKNYWLLLLSMLLTKTVIEIIYLLPVSGFFDKRRQLITFPLLQPLHIVYIVSAGFLGMFKVYEWKGRMVK